MDLHEDEMDKELSKNAADAAMCRWHFMVLYWTRKRPEGLKKNNDE